MSLDQRLRNGLHNAASTVTPDHPAALRSVLRTARRRRRTVMVLRLAVAVAFAIVVTLGALVAVDRLRTSEVIVAAPPPVAGRYTVTVADSEVARDVGLVGRWQVELRADGALQLTPPTTAFRYGRTATYRVQGDQLRTDLFLDVPGCQQTQPQVATYRWVRVGEDLRFTPVTDGCAARRILFTNQPWEQS